MEEKRPNEFFPIYEDEKGTYILNAKDLCMIDHIDKLAEAGVDSFKIEGRAKSSYYVSVITNAYRRAMDEFLENPQNFKLSSDIHDEVFKVSHRAYCTGFFFGHPKDCQYYENSGYIRDWDVVAIVTGYDRERGLLKCVQRNKFLKGSRVELLAPGGAAMQITADELFDEQGEPIESTRHATMEFYIKCDSEFPKNTIIRIEK
jgi:putative protease